MAADGRACRTRTIRTPAADQTTLMNPPLYDLLFFSSVPIKLDSAHRLHRLLEPVLKEDPLFLQIQRELEKRSAALAAQMTGMQLAALCSHCAATADGGCCSSEMAGETDAVQILINLLAGVEVGVIHADEKACCFLGTRGCIFTLKPMFCLNYNCTRIHGLSRGEQIPKLEERAGRLLAAQYRLERYLLEVIARENITLQPSDISPRSGPTAAG